jgi:Mrp family chromosome partitioning ATPase
MSVIDQAFVKAYSRRNQTAAASEPVQQVPDTIVSPPDVSINPQSEESAIVWIDAIADQYLRRDQPHRPHPAQPRPAEVSAKTDGSGNPGGERRTRGTRPTPQAIPPQNPSVATDPLTNRVSPTTATRLDDGHPLTGPTVIQLTESAKTELPSPAPAQDSDRKAVAEIAHCADILQFATLPWIEASSTLVETPLHHAITGPYYSDSVIVQENYLPSPVVPAPQPVESTASPTLFTKADEPATAAAPAKAEVVIPVEIPKPAAAPELKPSPKQTTPQPFTAVWEVDGFEFSDTVIALFGDVSLIKSIGFPLDRAVSEGLQTLLITSIEQGAGRTTVATGIAIAAATAGLRVALVDATMATAPVSETQIGSSLADALNLEIQYGWIEAVRGGISIAETAIHSIEDQLTVLPLVVPMAGLPPTSDEFARVVETLRQSFDLIVIDGPPCTEAAFRPLVSHRPGAPSIDAAILVQDMRQASADQANRVMETLRRDGITGLGMVQNFV